MRPSEIAQSVEALYAARRPVFVWGPAGVGKSQVVKQVTTKLGIQLIDVRASQLDPVDTRGIPYAQNGRSRFAIPEFLPTEGNGILFFDELNRADKGVQNALLQLVLDRKLGEYTLPCCWSIVAAGNFETSRGVTKMGEALSSRFVHLTYEVHLDDWCKWAVENDIPPQLIAFVRFRPNLLHLYEPQSSEKAFPCPRTWEFVADIIKTKVPNNIEHELFKGTVGAGAAAELSGFLRIWRKLPSLDSILMNPATVNVPDDHATLFAISAGLARKASDKNFDRVMTYGNRMPKEWQVFLVKDAVRREPDLQNTDSFIRWASVNAEVMG